jgi:hypothetical protein
MGRARTFTGTTSGTVKDVDRIAMAGRATVCASFVRMNSLIFFTTTASHVCGTDPCIGRSSSVARVK